MKTKFSRFCLLAIICSNISIIAAAQQININDSLTLVDLYNSTNGPRWITHTNWLSGPVKTWYGVRMTGGRVTRISLRYNELNGYIPTSIHNLSSLDTLDLGHNYGLTGQIPSAISNLTNLTYLSLETCSLNGKIPTAIGDLSNLVYLNLLDNQLTGKIPVSIGKLHKIWYLNVAINQLQDTIPSVISNLVNLTYLYLSDNLLTGSIPASFGKLTNLVNLVLRNNRLTGVLPSSLGNLIHLQYAYFDRNYLSGGISDPILNLTKLILLDVSSNLLSFSRNIDTSARLGNSQILMNVSYNNITFNGNEFFGQQNKYHNIIYTPQAPIKIHQQANTLSVSAGGTLSNNTYTWYKVGKEGKKIIKGDSVLHPAANGQYYATVTNSIATKLTLYTDTITYTAPPVNAKTTITVYPNPARDALTINGLDAGANNNITIADVAGYVWLSAAAKQQASVKLNVSKLKPGYYMVTVRNAHFLSTAKFMKE